ncbi:protein XAP5 CIRCADIAN TIMEKEEPER-like [Spinacia oleracea]|uniref:Protein XAP5 CIRCADIAN TIMEKEEPER-like n=1 Tax=Spinacia oleracea TaxID=3562 RepID=A0ABM3QQX7_SPIOL|nr:protein XAP5 CIRCADIAN TIMEKEEPER-like [Spinacia oleracea]
MHLMFSFVLSCKEAKLQLENCSKRKSKVDARLSFADDITMELKKKMKLLGWKKCTKVTFLRAVQQQLALEFQEAWTASVENLLYLKEDLIIPHKRSFYELIMNKAKDKSGPAEIIDMMRILCVLDIVDSQSPQGKN